MEAQVNSLESELNSKTIKLHWLLQITKAINYNLPASELYRIYNTVLRDHLKVGKLMLFINDSGWRQILSYGIETGNFNIDFDNDFKNLNVTEPSGLDKAHWISHFETIIPVYHNDHPLAYAFIGDYSQMVGSRKRIVPFIHTITNLIVVAIENHRLTKESIRQAAMQKEMQLAAEMQNMLFPASLNGNGSFDIDAVYLPHQQVGGDYYDYFKVSDDESIICMADVSGKGLAAALLMSNFQANLHAITRHLHSFPEIITGLNATVFKNAKGEKYITVFLARINHKTKQVQYINAGHNPPVLFHEGNFKLLENGTIGLGMMEHLPFINEGIIHFPKNAMLFCYTDGITELEDANGNSFGLDNCTQLLQKHAAAGSMSDFHTCVIMALNEFRKDTAFNDDVTLLSLRSL